MKISKLMIAGLIATAAQVSLASPICGSVQISETCDVDYCGIHFVTQDYVPGQTSALAIGAGGIILSHDYEVRSYGLDRFTDGTFCVDSASLSPRYPIVEINDLVESN